MSNDILADVFLGERGFVHALLQIFGENAILLRGDGARLRVVLARSNDVERKLDATGDALFDLYREGFRAAISPVGRAAPPTPGHGARGERSRDIRATGRWRTRRGACR